jgi:hypothetical protein
VQPDPEVVPSLAILNKLKSLTIGNGRLVRPRGFDTLLPHLPSLQRIQVTGGTPKDVRALQRMPNLVDLDLVLASD